MPTNSEKDHWSPQKYSAAAAYVPQLADKLLQYLNPQSNDRVLDIGCGDGVFTSKFADAVSGVLGIDSSPSMIESAEKAYGSSRVNFKVVDGRYLDQEGQIVQGNWDKIVSNAAFHWILRDSETRSRALEGCYAALRPGGTFVLEMGGAGNVAEVHAALIAALIHQGQSFAQAREASPWFFPSVKWMRRALEDVGFEVLLVESEHRPTKLTVGENSATGLEGWLRLFGAAMLETLETKEKIDGAVREVCEVLKTVIVDDEDGSSYLNYVRLRAVARRTWQQAKDG
ncbi:MAG: hypothetical protein Q9227_006167 [Pyrenula ochraceoflavens]